jgi:hypothetical protein
MVVDDEVIITTEMKDFLTLMGYEVAGLATSGEDAIEMARQVRPDLILMDIIMPRKKIDGLTASEIIKKELGIPVVFMTAYGGEKILDRVKSAEPFGFILKPFQENELRAAIEVALLRKEMEQRIRESEEKYRSVVNAAVDAIFTFDASGTVVYANPAADRLFGCTSGGLAGLHVSRLFPDSVTRALTEEMNAFIAEGRADLLGKTQQADGIRTNAAPFAIEFALTAWKVREGVFFTFIGRDITERRKIDRMKNDFVALVSHQLKTPVAGIMGCVDNLLDGLAGDLTDKQKEYLAVMREVSERNYRVISNLLNVSRLERGAISVELQPCGLNGIVALSVRGYQDAVQKKGLFLTVHPAPGDIQVLVDKDKTVEALINGVDNAIKYTSKGGITIDVKRDGRFGTVEIHDTGPGIPADVQERLFTRDRVLMGAPSVEGGCGLGLYTAMEFVRLQRGNISVHSTPGQGSTFIFALPLANPSDG